MSEETREASQKKKTMVKVAGIGLALLAVVVVAWYTGLTDYLIISNLNMLRDWIHGLGAIAPIVFIVMYAVAVVAFLPAAPLTLAAGLVFGAVWGTLWTWIGATLGSTLAFLAGRYAARGLVESWKENNERVKRLDEGVEKHGWRMLLITRLVPVFPFSLQNYAYGLTKIGLVTYALVTGICIVPGVIVYTFAGGSLTAAQESLTMTFLYLGIAAVFFVLISFVPNWIRKRHQGQDS
ncbi:MAG: TVP38/TMEM64 family protein [Actinobacteria bacterium]|nr:TVP38/TMEM64 family protein [Actinomycetota bacterium]